MENNSKKTNVIAQDCSSACMNILFAILFGVYTSDSKYHSGCSENTSLYNWGYITFVYHAVSAGLSCCVLPGIALTAGSSSGTGLTLGSGLILFTRLGMLVVQLTCFGGLCYAYGEEEPCWDSDLRKLTLAYIILCSIGIGILGVVLCCLTCCGAIFGISALASGSKSNDLQALQNAVNDLQANINKMEQDNVNKAQGEQNNNQLKNNDQDAEKKEVEIAEKNEDDDFPSAENKV